MPVLALFTVMRDHQVQFPRAWMTNGRYGWRHELPWQPQPWNWNQRPLPDVIGNLFSLSLPPRTHGIGGRLPGGWRVVQCGHLAFSRTSGTVDVPLDDTSIMRASGLADWWTSERVDIVGRLNLGRLPQQLVDRPRGLSVHYWCRLGRRLLLLIASLLRYRRQSTPRTVRHRDAADPRTRLLLLLASEGHDPDRFKTASCWRRLPRDDEWVGKERAIWVFLTERI